MKGDGLGGGDKSPQVVAATVFSRQGEGTESLRGQLAGPREDLSAVGPLIEPVPIAELGLAEQRP